MRLVVGLGNPGPAYALTRHNVGALALERAAKRWAIPWQSAGGDQDGARYGARYGEGRVAGHEVLLALTLAWMNQSGPAVKVLLDRADAGVEDLVVVHDDLDLPLGRIRIKRRGGAGGHRGVLSLLTSLGSDRFCRVKLGIGHPPAEQDPAAYVLSPFSSDERAALEATLDRTVCALECLLVEGIDAAMNQFNPTGNL